MLGSSSVKQAGSGSLIEAPSSHWQLSVLISFFTDHEEMAVHSRGQKYFLLKVPDNKYFRLWGSTQSLLQGLPSAVVVESSHKQYMNKRDMAVCQ